MSPVFLLHLLFNLPLPTHLVEQAGNFNTTTVFNRPLQRINGFSHAPAGVISLAQKKVKIRIFLINSEGLIKQGDRFRVIAPTVQGNGLTLPKTDIIIVVA